MGPLIPLLWTYSDVCPRFQSWGESPHLHALSPACNKILKFSSGATAVDRLAASMAAKPFYPHTCAQALLGLKLGIYHAAASQCETRQTLYQLSYVGLTKKNCVVISSQECEVICRCMITSSQI